MGERLAEGNCSAGGQGVRAHRVSAHRVSARCACAPAGVPGLLIWRGNDAAREHTFAAVACKSPTQSHQLRILTHKE